MLFDSDNTTVVLRKYYINCERNYFIMFDDDCLVHADPQATVNDVANVEMDTWNGATEPFPSPT